MQKILNLLLMIFLISCQTPELKPVELCFEQSDICVCSMYQVTVEAAGQVGESYEVEITRCTKSEVSLNLDDTAAILDFHDEIHELYQKRNSNNN